MKQDLVHWLELDFHDYWLAGSGSASTPWLDEHVEKSSDDLPFFAGRALKGVLRDAVRCAQEWGWLPAYPQGMSPHQQAVWPGWTVALFGSSQTEQGGLSPNQSRSASLLIGNANLPEEVQAFLRQRPEHKEQLQRALFATSIDDETGVALAGSLRGMEVSVPMLLLAPIEALPHAPLGWQEVVQQVLPLLRGIGKRRSRGLGRVTVSLHAVQVSKEAVR